MGENDPKLSDNALNDEATGLPGLRSWSTVYVLVTLTFIIYVVLLSVLKQVFS